LWLLRRAMKHGMVVACVALGRQTTGQQQQREDDAT